MTSKAIHICFINLRAYPLFNADVTATIGGAEVDLYLIATELAKDSGYEVSFVTGDFGQAEVERVENVKVIKSIDVGGNLFLQGWRLWRALGMADADIYFDECAGLRTWLDAAFCRLKKRPYVFRTAASEECDGTYLRNHWFRGRAFARAIRTAAQVIAQNTSDQLRLCGRTGIESVVIRNASHPVRQHDTPREKILWVGRSAAVKGPRRFLELARENPGLNFTMICQPAAEDTAFGSLSDEAAAIPNLAFVPGVPFREIDRYFMSAKVLVNTSDSEGFPNVFVQAAKCGTPILSLNVNPDGFLHEYECGLCAGGDWRKMGEMLSTLLEPASWEKYSRNAYHYARDNHDIGTIIEKYKEVLQKVAGEAPR